MGRATALWPMSSPDSIADALALALLAGPWERAQLCERAEYLFGERPRWLRSLVRHLLARFPIAPNDASQGLSEAILSAPSFRRGVGPGQPLPRLVRLVVTPPTMGPCRWAVPALCTTVDLASWLELSPAELDWFADTRGLNAEARSTRLEHYRFRWVQKRRGGVRLLEAPKPRLKAFQTKVLREILDHVPAHSAAHGFVRGRSVLTCVEPHAGRQTLLRLDLQEFFPSIGAARIRRIFRALGYPELVSRVLTGLCSLEVSSTVLSGMPAPSFVEQLDAVAIAARSQAQRRLRHRHLPQGAPTSPALANLACYQLDTRLHAAAEAAGAVYTRYADDLVFSGGVELARRAPRLVPLLAAIAWEEGLRVNHHKTRVMRQAQSHSVLGLVTNERAHVPRAERERLEAILTNAARHGLESQNRDGNPQFLASLRGRVAWVEHVHPPHARKLRRLLAACEAALRP